MQEQEGIKAMTLEGRSLGKFSKTTCTHIFPNLKPSKTAKTEVPSAQLRFSIPDHFFLHPEISSGLFSFQGMKDTHAVCCTLTRREVAGSWENYSNNNDLRCRSPTVSGRKDKVEETDESEKDKKRERRVKDAVWQAWNIL